MGKRMNKKVGKRMNKNWAKKWAKKIKKKVGKKKENLWVQSRLQRKINARKIYVSLKLTQRRNSL